jgi:hypothetical protein
MCSIAQAGSLLWGRCVNTRVLLNLVGQGNLPKSANNFGNESSYEDVRRADAGNLDAWCFALP